MKSIRLSREADRDLSEIRRYTRHQFGPNQVRRLRRQLRQTLLRLAQHPDSAPQRPELDPVGQTFRYATFLRSYLIVYRQDAQRIVIARILHTARNISEILANDTEER